MSSLIKSYWRALQNMKYKVNFRIEIDGREIVDTIVVDAENEKDALKKVKESTLSRPKLVSIKEETPEKSITEKQIGELNSRSKVQLDSPETHIAQEVFQNAVKMLTDKVFENNKLSAKETRAFRQNRIIMRLAEMFENKIETNY